MYILISINLSQIATVRIHYLWNTSSHSVAPTAPKSPALQLAKIMLLLGLNPPGNGQKLRFTF